MNPLPVLTLLAGLLGYAAMGVVPGGSRLGGGLVAAGAALWVLALRPLLEGRGDREVAALRRIELALLVLVVPVLMLVVDREGPLAAVLAAWVVATTVWLGVNGTVSDLELAARGVGEGIGPLGRIRLRFSAAIVVVVLAEGIRLVGASGFLDLQRPSAAGLPVAGLLFVLVGMAGLSRAALLAERSRWERDGALVDAEVDGAWTRRSAGILVLVAAVILLLPPLTVSLAAVPLRLFLTSGGPGDWLAGAAERLGGGEPASPGETAAEQPPPVLDETGEGPAWLGDVAFWLFVAIILSSAVIAAYRRRREDRRGPVEGGWLRPGELARSLVTAMRELLLAAWRLLAGLWSQARTILRNGEPPESAQPEPPDELWAPDDPARGRIAAAYRTFTKAAGAVLGRRSPGETAGEFAQRAMALQHGTSVGVLTGLYQEARYSAHPLGDAEAAHAEEAAREVVAGLAEGRRRAGG